MGRAVSPFNIKKIWTNGFNLRHLYMNCVESLSSITLIRFIECTFTAVLSFAKKTTSRSVGSAAIVQKLHMQPLS